MQLLFLMIEHIGLIVAIAFILTRAPAFRKLMDNKLEKSTIIKLIILFGIFGIIGTYTGITIKPLDVGNMLWMPKVEQINGDEALANSRVVGVAVGGLLGGPWVGLGAGLIAGIHRMLLGGFTGLACGLSTILEGVIAGVIYKHFGQGRIISISKAFLTGIVIETVQMFIILFMAKPFSSALALVQIIGLPMILANSIGIALFIAIISSVVQEEDRLEANQAQKVLLIADKMLVHLRKGLTQDSAKEISKLLLKTTGVAAVSITNREQILSHVGLGDDHHLPGYQILTEATKKVLRTGEFYVPKTLQEIACPHEGCPLTVAIIVPLKKSDEVIGVLKFYFPNPKHIKPVDEELAQGLGRLLSHQIEVVEAQKQAKLVREAELKALQAQINPHFLFNSLNTIVALIRIKPEMARKLLVQLGSFFRQNLNASTHPLVSLQQELDHTQAYLTIEKARFAEKLNIEINIDDRIEGVFLPPLTLQPLVENGIKHGHKELSRTGEIKINVFQQDQSIRIVVWDNGVGMTTSRISELLHRRVESHQGTGLGLYNVNQRLIYNFGEESRLHIESTPAKGTEVWFSLPRQGGVKL